jgi:hypothetical protein
VTCCHLGKNQRSRKKHLNRTNLNPAYSNLGEQTRFIDLHLYVTKIVYLVNLPDLYTESHNTTDLNYCIGVVVEDIEQDD